LAIFLLHNFMKDIPPSLVEAPRVDGAGHVRIFFRVLLPLLVPAIASFAIFQFLWVWNDLLVSLTFAGGRPNVAPLTVRIAEMVGTRGSDWFLLSAGAFLSMIVPGIVFRADLRYFVRGMMAGPVNGCPTRRPPRAPGPPLARRVRGPSAACGAQGGGCLAPSSRALDR